MSNEELDIIENTINRVRDIEKHLEVLFELATEKIDIKDLDENGNTTN